MSRLSCRTDCTSVGHEHPEIGAQTTGDRSPTSPASGARWHACLLALGIPRARHIQRPHRGTCRRIYRSGGSVYKIEMDDPQQEELHYRNNLFEEWQILKQVHGVPGVAEARGFARGPGWQAMELEFLPGSDLVDQAPSLQPVVSYTGQLCRTLYDLSMRGIAHNDVLPRNVLLGADSTLYLLDFDQATRHRPFTALYRNFVGIGRASNRPYGSFTAFVVLALVDRLLPVRVRAWLRVRLSRERRHQRMVASRGKQMEGDT
jgi:serine/threonine protein kinase